MKLIENLKADLYQLMNNKGWFSNELADELARDVATRLMIHHNKPEGPPTLRMSKLGPTCPHALWQSIYHPELAEPLPPQAMIKYAYGHMVEAQLISYCKAAGHTVTGEQDELHADGIVGHRDGIVDGHLCDFKSVSSFQFAKFEKQTLWMDDSFGYLDQLDAYVYASLDDPLLLNKDIAFIIAIDKVLGKIALYRHEFRKDHIRNRIGSHKRIVGLASPPPCTCGTVPEGKSGNVKLDIKASYSAFKHVCFPQLRTFIYSDGPVYLTHVSRRPDVPEVGTGIIRG